MKVTLSSVLVDDQAKALAFYTDVLGFVRKLDLPAGEYRWLTIVSPEGHDDVEVVLEPNVFPAAKVYQLALYAAGIPATSFASTDIQAEYERLVARGVVFRTQPTQMGPATVAMFDDTCGNFIQLHQV
jgi:predicted enzyme related to lactoylglutathione lyase